MNVKVFFASVLSLFVGAQELEAVDFGMNIGSGCYLDVNDALTSKWLSGYLFIHLTCTLVVHCQAANDTVYPTDLFIEEDSTEERFKVDADFELIDEECDLDDCSDFMNQVTVTHLPHIFDSYESDAPTGSKIMLEYSGTNTLEVYRLFKNDDDVPEFTRLFKTKKYKYVTDLIVLDGYALALVEGKIEAIYFADFIDDEVPNNYAIEVDIDGTI